MFIWNKNSPSEGRTRLPRGLDTKIARQSDELFLQPTCSQMRKPARVVLTEYHNIT
nr:MAG TPA: hypothetical protein [Caudoviricetes sp.]